jgi:hypothetical protein
MTSLLCGIVFICVFQACATNTSGLEREQNLYGMVYDREHKPLHNVAVYIDGVHRASSDINGRFVLSGLDIGGAYTITVSKERYETMETHFVFGGSAQVLYLNLISGGQLLAEAEKAIEERRWMEAEAFLLRAEGAEAETVFISFLRAALAYRRGQNETALQVLMGMIEAEQGTPHVYLFIADMYQYKLSRPEEAAHWLQLFLDMRYDAAVQARLSALAS